MHSEYSSVILTPPRHPHLSPRGQTPVLTFELTGRKTVDTASDHAIAMQTLKNNWDSYDATIYTDGTPTHGNENGGSGIIIITGPQVTLASTVSTLSRPTNGARPYKPKRKLCQQPSNWIRRMSPSTRCASFQIVCQHSSACNISTHPDMSPMPTKARFSSPTSLSYHLTFTCRHGHSGVRRNELADVATKEGTTLEQEKVSRIMTRRKRQCGWRLRNTPLPTCVYAESTAKEEK